MRYENSCQWDGIIADEVLFLRADKVLWCSLCKQRQVAALSLLMLVQSNLHISLDVRSPSDLLSDPCVCHFIEWLRYTSPPNSIDNVPGSFNCVLSPEKADDTCSDEAVSVLESMSPIFPVSGFFSC